MACQGRVGSTFNRCIFLMANRTWLHSPSQPLDFCLLLTCDADEASLWCLVQNTALPALAIASNASTTGVLHVTARMAFLIRAGSSLKRSGVPADLRVLHFSAALRPITSAAALQQRLSQAAPQPPQTEMTARSQMQRICYQALMYQVV